MKSEVERFKRTDEYLCYEYGRRSISASFLHGMALSIAGKLRAMKAQRDTAHKLTGRDLVLVKSATVDNEFAKLGMAFVKRQTGQRRVNSDAFDAGRAAGQSVAINPGVGHGFSPAKVRVTR